MPLLKTPSTLTLTLTLSLTLALAHAQAPPNDACAKAISIEPGQMLSGHSNQFAGVGYEFSTPATVETTCIQTIENDVWFKFTTREDYEWYEVVIATRFCNTPAGLQALLIRSDDCNNKHYQYRACSNKINTDTIKLFLSEPEAGHNYLVWIDGYDGTMCEFDIYLRGRTRLKKDDYRYLRFDYELDEPEAEMVPNLQTEFVNNQAVIRWSAEADDPTETYVVELLPELEGVDQESRYARIVGFVDRRNLVQLDRTYYVFRDFLTPFEHKQTYTYRIVGLDAEGNRATTEHFRIRARMIEGFYVGEVSAADSAGNHSVHYINRQKNQRYALSVLDADQAPVKQMVFEREPVRDGNITLKMAEYPAGTYYFKMDDGKNHFLRPFVVDGRQDQ